MFKKDHKRFSGGNLKFNINVILCIVRERYDTLQLIFDV